MHKHAFLLCTILSVLFSTGCSLAGQDQPVEPTPLPEIVIDKVSVEVLDIGLEPAIQTMVYGHYLDSCTEITKGVGAVTQVYEDGVFYISIQPVHLEDTDCNLPGGDFQRGIGLIHDQLPSGEYVVDVHGVRRPFVIEADESVDWDTLNLITEMVRDAISTNYGVTELSFVHMERAVWSNSCMEIPFQDQACTEAEIPGYLFVAGDGKQIWTYHTNSDGSLLLEDPSGGAGLDGQSRPTEGVEVSVLPEHYAVNVRSGPGQDYHIQGRLEANDPVLAVGISESGLWLQVVYQDDPLPFTLAWLYAPLTDYSRGVNELPVIPSESLPAAELGSETNYLVNAVADFIAGLREQSQLEPGLTSPSLEQPLELLLLLHDDRMLTPAHSHNALYHFSLVDGLRLLYSPPQDGTIFDYCLPPEQDAIYLVLEFPTIDEGEKFALYRLPLTGGEAEWVADLPDNLAEVQLSPDGRELLFLRQSSGVKFELFKLGVDGQQMTMFYLSGSVRSYAWSPDGARVAVAMADETGSTDLFLMDADGGNLIEIFDRTGMDHLGGWSADGTQLVFSHIENGNEEIFSLNLNTGGIANLSDYSFPDHWPVWSPDGRYVAYQSQRFDSLSADSLMVWDSLTKQAVNISRGIVHQTVFLEDWSPDSRYALAVSEVGGDFSYHIIDVLNQQAYLLLGDLLTETGDISKMRWVEGLQPAGASQSLGEYWLVPVSPEMVFPQEESDGQLVLVTVTEDMNVRSGPGIDYELVGELDIHSRVQVVGRSWDGYWLKVNFARLGEDGGWIFTELTDFDPETVVPVLPGPVIDLVSQQALPD